MSNLRISPNLWNKIFGHQVWRSKKPNWRPLTITILDILVIVLVVYFLKFYYSRNPFVQKRIGPVSFVLTETKTGSVRYFKMIIRNSSRQEQALDTGPVFRFYIVAPNNMIVYQKTFDNRYSTLLPRQRITFTTDLITGNYAGYTAEFVFSYKHREDSIKLRVR